MNRGRVFSGLRGAFFRPKMFRDYREIEPILTWDEKDRLRLEAVRERDQRETAELSDRYVTYLFTRNTKIQRSQVPLDLIRAKRMYLQIKRRLQEGKE